MPLVIDCADTAPPSSQPLHPLWARRQNTKFNGTSYIIQRGAEAVYTSDGRLEQRMNSMLVEFGLPPADSIEDKQMASTFSRGRPLSDMCSEIFFRIDEKLNPYYCLEIDPLGRVLDYRGNFHRKFDRDWSWPEKGLQVKTHRSEDGYTLELAIAKASLEQLGLLRSHTLQAGLYRADCFPGKNGPRDFKWISWIRPESPSPDFHIPSSFGELRLEH